MRYNVVFSRLYWIEAKNEAEAIERAKEDFDLDMELGFITSDNDDFSITVSEINK